MWNACCHHNSWLVSDFLITWYETQTKREREWEWNKSGKVLIYVHIFTYALNCNDTKGANKLLKKHCIGDRERKRERRRSNILQISCKHQIEYCWRLNASFVQDRIEREREWLWAGPIRLGKNLFSKEIALVIESVTNDIPWKMRNTEWEMNEDWMWLQIVSAIWYFP